MPGITSEYFGSFPQSDAPDISSLLEQHILDEARQHPTEALNLAVTNRLDQLGCSITFQTPIMETVPGKPNYEQETGKRAVPVSSHIFSPFSDEMRTQQDLWQDTSIFPAALFPAYQPNNISSIDLIHRYVSKFVFENDRSLELSPFFELSTVRWKSVYSFVDEFEHTRMKLLKVLDPKYMFKLLIPVIYCTRKTLPGRDYYCIPLMEQQSLYNRYLLESRPEDIVMLSDSVEIADMNQGYGAPNIIWASWYGGIEALENVDLTPLKDRTVYYVITNHSGRSLEMMCRDAKEISEALKDLVGTLKFAVVPVEYPDAVYADPSEFFDCSEDENYEPSVQTNAVRIYTFDELDELLKRANDRIEKTSVPFHIAESGENHYEPKQEQTSAIGTDYILRPLLYNKRLSLLYATRGSGKTSFAMSICGSLISGSQEKSCRSGRWVINGKCWTIPDKVRKSAAVMFFDFELLGNEEDIKEIQARHLEPYLPDPEKEEHLRRFQLEHIDTDEIDPLSEDGHRRITESINKFKKNMPNGCSLKLVVFDNYLSMITHRDDNKKTFMEAAKLFKKILNHDTAVLLIHHSNKNLEQYGSTMKENAVVASVRLDRQEGSVTKEDRSTLKRPMNVTLDKGSKSPCDRDYEPFQVFWQDGKTWEIYKPDMEANKEFKIIADEYLLDKNKPSKPSIKVDKVADLMGYGTKQAFYNVYKGETPIGKKH